MKLKTSEFLGLIGVSGVLIALSAGPGLAADWVDGRGQRCDLACEAQGSTAVESGTYGNGESYFVCEARLPDGDRPGYNLAPNWSNACYVGNGGREQGVNLYSCLCE